MSLCAGRAGRVDATRACFGGAARSATPRGAEHKKVSLLVPPGKETPRLRRTTREARRDNLSSQTEKTFKMGAVDVLFGADGTPRCA